MNKFCLFILFFISLSAIGQDTKYFQQQVDYRIDVLLNADTKTMDGFIEMDYTNHSSDTLTFIWMHIWPNAFKNDRTAFSEQLLQLGRTDFYFSNEEERGYINRLNFEVNNQVANTEDHPQYIDVLKLLLPEPLLPGQKALISTPFHIKIPLNFSRGGYFGDAFQITQWYPKPAVYDRSGWHPMPYLDQGEFYSEFGSFTVNISLPEKYKVAATGELVADTMVHFKSEQYQDFVQKRFAPNKSTNLQKLTFFQLHVHDFAWFADKHFKIKEDTMRLPSGRTVQVSSYHLPENEAVWKNSISFIKDAIRTRSTWLGEYPYSTVKVVETDMTFSGGMEYPTITNISPITSEKELDLLIAHEIGHNWNYGILASNERRYPWMDEGINSYYDHRYEELKYPVSAEVQPKGFLAKRVPVNYLDIGYRTLVTNKNDLPIQSASTDFSEAGYSLIAYYKASLWMKEVEKLLGREVFDSAMQTFYNEWKFKHPNPADLKAVLEQVSNQNLDSVFARLDQYGFLNPPIRKQVKPEFLFSFRDTKKYDYIFLSPALGLNFYDRVMIGGLIHNYTLPKPSLHFFAAPMYATGSSKLTGIGGVGYHWIRYGALKKIELFVNGSTFSMDAFKDSTGKNNYLGFQKLVPGLRLSFRGKNNLSAFAQWKTYLIRERSVLFLRDTIGQQDIITYPSESRYLNQFSMEVSNDRVLYPFRANIVLEQGAKFVRTTINGNYFFNYAKGGGMDARFFAGKFFYTADKTTSNQYQLSRYHLNMTGANGFEDYTYSNYFIGRNEFKGVSSQQLMIRDGGFKVRSDMLNKKIGKTDDWLVALNLTTNIPKQFDPLQVLPGKSPLRVFLDVGTYSEAWDKNSSNEKFLFDAGLQLSFLKDGLNIYIPILYSKVYGQYFKSTIPKEKRFWQNISFSIDIQKFNFYKWAGIPPL